MARWRGMVKYVGVIPRASIPSDHTNAPISTLLLPTTSCSDRHTSIFIPHMTITSFLKEMKIQFPNNPLAGTFQIVEAHPLPICYFSFSLPFMLLSFSDTHLYWFYPPPPLQIHVIYHPYIKAPFPSPANPFFELALLTPF